MTKLIRFLTYCSCALTVSLCLPMLGRAIDAPVIAGPDGLSMVELKITGDEFVLLQNNSAAPISDLSTYWLAAYNNPNPLAAGTSSSLEQLPDAGLLPGQTLLLSASPMPTCGASVAGKLSLSLSDSGGFLQLSQNSLNQNGALLQTPVDLVSWSSGAAGTLQNIPSNSKDSRAVNYRYLSASGYAWQQADLGVNDNCQLNVVVAGGNGSSSAVTPLAMAATSPPATILGQTGNAAAMLPAADIGLEAPQISELLPNPAGTNNDATDEFIELYNPNTTSFDLSGFSLQTGTTTVHTYQFPAGTMLAVQSFKAFYASDTHLTLSNSGGQAVLLDPTGATLSTSGLYGAAKDGLAWATAKNTWYWTTKPTPGAANIITQPTGKKTTKKTATITSGQSTTSGAATTSNTAPSSDAASHTAPIHFWILALVAAAALLYGAYEYRRDLANTVFQLSGYLKIGRWHWRPFARRRTPGAYE